MLARLARSFGLFGVVWLAAVSTAWAGAADKRLDVYWVDVEGGAATLIVTPAGESILIDTGNPGRRDADRIIQAVAKAGLRQIDILVTTHYHRDHFGGASTLAAAIPIRHVFDNGIFDGIREKPDQEYLTFAAGQRSVISPGDVLPIKQADGSAKLEVKCLATRQKTIAAKGTPAANECCGQAVDKPVDNSDNANSVVLLVGFGPFRFYDGGDLTWNIEKSLVCPTNLVGQVDVYQATHHGLDASNNPVLVKSLDPIVAIMNNGVTKGCQPQTFETITGLPSLEAMYQVHKNERPDGNKFNVPDEYIANRAAECQANIIHMSVDPEGKTYTVAIPANEHVRTFKTRENANQAGIANPPLRRGVHAVSTKNQAPGTKNSSSRTTNLIAIVTDDQGQWALGCYGNRDVRTPNMDRLAAEGALFSNAFTVTPVCSPSRAAYMSGRWPTQVGITDFLSPQESNGEGIGLKDAIWPAVLQGAGYRTAMIGKWHLGTLPPFHPTKKGFDLFYGFLGGGTTPMNPILEVRGKEQQVEGDEPSIHAAAAIEFIRANRDKPFAICLHFRAPHLPYGPVPEQDAELYKNVDPQVPQLPGLDIAKLKQSTRGYYASISNIDRAVGRVLAALDELKLADNTLVSFTSDHGYNEGRHSIDTKGNGQWLAGGVRGPKRPNMWDTSVRVPLMVRWPKTVAAGRVIDQPVSNIDTYRTMLGALGVKAPADSAALGVDNSPLLRGEKVAPRDAIYGQYDLHNSGLAYLRMVRTSKYKFVKHYREKLMDELYDLESDPGEERNLAARRVDHAKIVAELEGKLVEWQKSIDDPVLADRY